MGTYKVGDRVIFTLEGMDKGDWYMDEVSWSDAKEYDGKHAKIIEVYNIDPEEPIYSIKFDDGWELGLIYSDNLVKAEAEESVSESINDILVIMDGVAKEVGSLPSPQVVAKSIREEIDRDV
jgi:hypothetical protein